MIRFSHAANSWQLACSSNGWENISAERARIAFDNGLLLWHSEKLIVI